MSGFLLGFSGREKLEAIIQLRREEKVEWMPSAPSLPPDNKSDAAALKNTTGIPHFSKIYDENFLPFFYGRTDFPPFEK